MLTKSDFEQIRKIVREEVGNEAESVKDELGSDVRMSRIIIHESIDVLIDRVKNLEIRVRKMNKEDIEEDLLYADKE